MENINVANPRLTQVLEETGKWASRLSYFYIGFLVLGALFLLLGGASVIAMAMALASPEVASNSPFGALGAIGGVGLTIVAIFYFGIYAYLIFKLYKFGNALKRPANFANNSECIAVGYSEYASLMKALCIISVVVVVLSVLAAILFGGAILAAMNSAGGI